MDPPVMIIEYFFFVTDDNRILLQFLCTFINIHIYVQNKHVSIMILIRKFTGNLEQCLRAQCIQGAK